MEKLLGQPRPRLQEEIAATKATSSIPATTFFKLFDLIFSFLI